MSYRAPPAVLPSRRALLSPAAREGALLSCEATDADVDRAVSDAREDEARARAASVPCPRSSRDQGGGGSIEKTLALIRYLRDLRA